MKRLLLMMLAVTAGCSASAAEWIRPERTRRNAAFVLTKTFVVSKPLARAQLKASAAGIGVWRVNGAVVNGFSQPDVSYYERETFFETCEVTRSLAITNTLSVEVGGGWYEQNLAWACENHGQGISYGTPAAWGELVLTYTDGTTETLGTEASWRSADSPVVWNNIYGGEIYDARTDTRTGGVARATDITTELRAAPLPAGAVLDSLPAVSVTPDLGARTPSWIYDFGTNVAGTVRFTLPPLVPGSRLRVRLAETLTAEGALDPRSEGAFATHHAPEYVLIAPDTPQALEWTPRFSYTSFRYAEVSGFEPYPDDSKNWRNPPPADLLRALFIATPLRATSTFVCAQADVMRLLEIAHRTIRCNVHGIPEDCPGREKGGWLGDAQLVAPFVLQHYDAQSLYEQFMRHVAYGTELFGAIPCQVPTHRAFSWEPAPAIWRAAAVTIPYQVWMETGAASIVSNHWKLICKALAEFKVEAQDGLITTGYGDWAPPPNGNASATRMPVLHSSTLQWIACLDAADAMSRALALPRDDDWQALAKTVRARFNATCYDAAAHTYGYDGTDAAAWCGRVVPESDRDALIARLVQRIRSRDYQMTTGIYASPLLAQALFSTGNGDTLLKAFFNPKHPSYRTVLDDGFTTLPEDLADRHRYARGAGEPHSYSHPMHAGWLRCLIPAVGLVPLDPGYARFAFVPHPNDGLGDLSVRLSSGIAYERKGTVGRLTVPEGKAYVDAKGASHPGPCVIDLEVSHVETDNFSVR